MIKELENLCKNLDYISESDSKLTTFEGESLDFGKFFDNQISINPDWKPLKDFMSGFSNLMVVKFGEVETVVFVFGEKDDRIYGFKTFGVET